MGYYFERKEIKAIASQRIVWQSIELENRTVYFTHNRRKSLVDEKFFRTSKIKYMTIWLLYQKYIFSIHRSIKIKLIDVNANMYINLIKEDEFKVDDHVQISK